MLTVPVACPLALMVHALWQAKPAVEHVESPARGCYDGFLISRATVCQQRSPKRFPDGTNRLAVTLEVAASIVQPKAKAALDVARD